jgi:hypothetical protein
LLLLIYLASAICAAWAKLPMDVERYFLSQVLYGVAIEISVHIWGTHSPVYAAIYSIFTLVIISSMFGVLNGKMRSWNSVLFSFFVGFLVTLVCVASLHSPIPYYKSIFVIEGFFLTACGVFLIFNFQYTRPQWLYFSLGMLWLLLAGFRLCFAMGMGSAFWSKLNWDIPSLLCSVTFLGIAYWAHRQKMSGSFGFKEAA